MMVLNEFDVFVMKYLSANKRACNVTIMLVYNFFIAVWSTSLENRKYDLKTHRSLEGKKSSDHEKMI